MEDFEIKIKRIASGYLLKTEHNESVKKITLFHGDCREWSFVLTKCLNKAHEEFSGCKAVYSPKMIDDKHALDIILVKDKSIAEFTIIDFDGEFKSPGSITLDPK